MIRALCIAIALSLSGLTAGYSTDLPQAVRSAVETQPGLESSTPHFLGVASRRRNRDEEQAYALLHAAEQAARYSGIVARYSSLVQENGAGFARLEHVNVAWDESLEHELLSELEIVETVVFDRGTLVWAKAESLSSVPVDRHRLAGERTPPRWVFSTPSAPGVIVGVGVSARRRTLQDTIDAADAQALIEVLRIYELEIVADRRMLDGDRYTMRERGARRETTEAVLDGFHILDRYFTESGRHLYSLAIVVIDN